MKKVYLVTEPFGKIHSCWSSRRGALGVAKKNDIFYSLVELPVRRVPAKTKGRV